MRLIDAFAEAYANPNPLHVGALALGGAAMAWSLKRLIGEIRKTERRVSAVLEQRNQAAFLLRQARQQEGELRTALQELDGELEDITARAAEMQASRDVLQQVIPRHLNLFSQAWSRGDTLFEAQVCLVDGGRAGRGGSRAVHGYAAGPKDFRNRLAVRFPPATHLVIDITPVDLEEVDMAVTNLGGANQP
ncbi:hypothetical protein [Nitrospirillum iridis]|uniref:Uncharacterized protein n=1 Tax=Nitrospirillum iridis TaxID=765888 RepID=A0A7X0EEL2_9PROT|nr:hypothetical protein [Nitrospirillum iridis]MBB6253993.1 hypothetical protein [Nitrospirillum iridis]